MSIARLLAFLLVLTLFQVPLYVDAEEREFSEHEVKAGFIYNFAKFIEWPDETLPNVRTTITFCLIGTDPFGKALDAIDNKTVRDKRFETKNIGLSKDLKNCNILFISNSEKKRLPQILEILKGTSILTIGDTRGYAQQGIIINFTMEQKKVKFEINTASARKTKLIISSKLLRLAKIITE